MKLLIFALIRLLRALSPLLKIAGKKIAANPGSFLAVPVQMIANGWLGKPLQRFYWWTAGKKTLTGCWLALLWVLAGLACACGFSIGCRWSRGLETASTILLAIGLADGLLKAEPPKKP
jgi:hypothetical protein